MKHKNFLIRLMTYKENEENPTMLCAFFASNINELLKLYVTAKEKEIPIENPSLSKNNTIGYVEDIRLTFGDDKTFTTLNVYIEIVGDY